MLSALFENYIRPMITRPPRFQTAALCYAPRTDGPAILMITSRDTGRWVVPKGWPKAGTDALGTAIEEAWEEAGVTPMPGHRKRELGQYLYDKRLEGGVPAPTVVKVFALPVLRLSEDYPEKDERERRWMSIAEAAEAVDEPGLRDLILELPARID